jgi:hypothetical protein
MPRNSQSGVAIGFTILLAIVALVVVLLRYAFTGGPV